MNIDFSKEGYLVRYTDGMTGFVYSNPMDWPLSIINQIMCVHKMPKPQKEVAQQAAVPFIGVLQ